ncbi:hypothetical protein KM043_018244 [Ampulex compressa]|nr:hypothetical protein KM043_018244 [Ampulex compressa]
MEKLRIPPAWEVERKSLAGYFLEEFLLVRPPWWFIGGGTVSGVSTSRIGRCQGDAFPEAANRADPCATLLQHPPAGRGVLLVPQQAPTSLAPPTLFLSPRGVTGITAFRGQNPTRTHGERSPL